MPFERLRALCSFGGLVLLIGLGPAPTPAQAQSLKDLLRQVLPTPQSLQQAQRKMEQEAGDARCRAVVDWAGAPLPADDTAAPATAQRRVSPSRGVGSGNLPPQVMLFSDALFVPVFGKAFDALSPSERNDLYRSHFEACLRSPAYGTAIRQLMPRVAPPFQDMGGQPTPGWGVAGGRQPLSAARVAAAVQRMRGAGGEVATLLREIEGLPATAEGWSAFEVRRASLDEALRYSGAEARAAAQPRLAAAAQRLAEPQARRIADDGLAAGTGFAQASALREADDRLKAFEPHLPPADLAALRNPLRERAARLVDDELQADRRQLDPLPGGAAGLQPGAEWFARVNAKYDQGLRVRQPFGQLSNEFRTRRDGHLQAAAPALLARVRSARSEAEVRSLLEATLQVPGDTDSAPGQQLLAAAAERREAFAKASVLGEQANERAVATAAPAPAPAGGGASNRGPGDAARSGSGEGVVSSSTQREPTASEMYDILKGKFDEQAANVKNMNDQCKGGAGRADPASAVVCLSMMMAGSAGADEPLRITRFEKLGCDRASGKAGYVCDYMLATSGRVQQAGGALLAQMAGRGGAGQARFLKTRDGWVAFWGER